MELKDILTVVCTTTNVRRDLILGPSRKENVVTARFIYLSLSRKYTTCKAIEISSLVNRKVKVYFYALNQVEMWRKNNKNFKALYETINSQLLLSKQ